MKTRFFIMASCALVTALLFYWYEYRPSAIRSTCETEAIDRAKKLLKTKSRMDSDMVQAADNNMFLFDDKDLYYNSCLRKNGLPR